ncbi:MAG: CRISPR-associated protein Csx19 [Acidobacteria bacterium]|nr:CRISPR-associated protein Csx19 [Acidobacteriota bacterium]
MMEYKPTPLPDLIPLEPAQIPDTFAGRAGVWLVEQAAGLGGKIYALIHLDDGVLWGRVENDKLLVSAYKDWTPPLRTLTIQQCRLFGSKGELFIWRLAERVWRGRKVIDRPGMQVIPEEQLLIGNRVVADDLPDDFTAIREESTGLRQVVPLPAKVDDDNRVALVVRHYLSEDEDGQAIIKCSRLVDLIPKPLTRGGTDV